MIANPIIQPFKCTVQSSYRKWPLVRTTRRGKRRYFSAAQFERKCGWQASHRAVPRLRGLSHVKGDLIQSLRRDLLNWSSGCWNLPAWCTPAKAAGSSKGRSGAGKQAGSLAPARRGGPPKELRAPLCAVGWEMSKQSSMGIRDREGPSKGGSSKLPAAFLSSVRIQTHQLTSHNSKRSSARMSGLGTPHQSDRPSDLLSMGPSGERGGLQRQRISSYLTEKNKNISVEWEAQPHGCGPSVHCKVYRISSPFWKWTLTNVVPVFKVLTS